MGDISSGTVMCSQQRGLCGGGTSEIIAGGNGSGGEVHHPTILGLGLGLGLGLVSWVVNFSASAGGNWCFETRSSSP